MMASRHARSSLISSEVNYGDFCKVEAQLIQWGEKPIDYSKI